MSQRIKYQPFKFRLRTIKNTIAHHEKQIAKHERWIVRHIEKIEAAKQDLKDLLKEYRIDVESLRTEIK